MTDIQFAHALPESIIGAGLVLLIAFVSFFGSKSVELVAKSAVIILITTIAVTIAYEVIDEPYRSELFIYNSKLYYISLIFAYMCFFMIFTFSGYRPQNYMLIKFQEAYFMLLAAMVGIFVCFTANNFTILFVGLEIYSLTNYFMITHGEKDFHDVLTKFILQSFIASAVFLYGVSLCYYSFSSFSFNAISAELVDIKATTGLLLVLISILFKLGVFPMHAWLVDVYKTAPLFFVMFLDTAGKFALVIILANFVDVLKINDVPIYENILAILATASMLVGSVSAIFQTEIRRFIAYSSIGHVGFVLIMFSAANDCNLDTLPIMYILCYAASSLTFFFTILYCSNSVRNLEKIDDLNGLYKVSPITSVALAISLFALIGLPPFINFFAKLSIFSFMIASKSYILATIAALYSIVCMLYVIKIMRRIFFYRSSFVNSYMLANANKTKFSVLIVSIVVLILTISIGGIMYSNIEKLSFNIHRRANYLLTD